MRKDKYEEIFILWPHNRNMPEVTGNPKFTYIISSHSLGRLDKSEDLRKLLEDLETKT